MQNHRRLVEQRKEMVARSFYRHLRSEGFSPEQVIDLSATLLDLVTEDLTPKSRPEAK